MSSHDGCQECAAASASRNAAKKARKMSCPELLKKINELLSAERRGRSGTKGLIQRFRDYLGDDLTHGEQIMNQQRAVQAYLNEFRSKNCGDPPSDAPQWATKPLPVPVQASPSPDAAKATIAVSAGVGVGYIVYRVLRFLPSLAVPPTIPFNLAIP